MDKTKLPQGFEQYYKPISNEEAAQLFGKPIEEPLRHLRFYLDYGFTFVTFAVATNSEIIADGDYESLCIISDNHGVLLAMQSDFLEEVSISHIRVIAGTATDFDKAKWALEEFYQSDNDDDVDIFESVDCYIGPIEEEVAQAIAKERNIENLFIEPSVQANRGRVYISATGYESISFDFQDWINQEREHLLDASTEEELRIYLKSWLEGKLENFFPID